MVLFQVELEKELHKKVTELQTVVAPHPPIRHSLLEDEAGMLHELTQVIFIFQVNKTTKQNMWASEVEEFLVFFKRNFQSSYTGVCRELV